MRTSSQITRNVIGAVVSLLLVITSVHAEEEGHSNVEYGVTTYGIFNLATNGSANDGKVHESEDSMGDYPGLAGQGGGAGLGFSAMWRGYVGIDVQMLYTTHELSGSFDDPLSGQLDFTYKLAQFDFPIMLKAAYPNRYVTPSIAMGPVLRKDFSDIGDEALTGGEADIRVGQGFSEEHWLARFGAGLEKTLPLEGHDLRFSLNIMVNYDGHIADGFEADEIESICNDQQNGNATERVCTLVPEFGTIWRTDIMLGVGYHF